jgi:hypothetical protein
LYWIEEFILFLKYNASWAWWNMPVIPALGRLRQEYHEFEASLDYIVTPYIQNKQNLRMQLPLNAKTSTLVGFLNRQISCLVDTGSFETLFCQ